MKISIFHNILWSKYKGAVFTKLHNLTKGGEFSFQFSHIATTEHNRSNLAEIDKSYHQYPYNLIFDGAYDDIPLWRLVVTLAQKVRTSKANLILLPGYHRIEYWAMLFACIQSRKKRAVFCDSTAYDRPSSLLKSAAKRFFFHFCDGYFGYGSRSREYLLSLGAHPSKIFSRCQAAALPHNYDKDTAFSARLQSVARMDNPRFLFVGRLSWEKALDNLLDAFKLVLVEFPGARLVLAGSGPLRGELEARCRYNGITSAVEFLGSMALGDLAHEYSKATCLVLPSRSEPWGLVVNEALAYGCPVVVSNVCGCVPELVLANETGYEFKVGDVRDLADCMIKLAKTFTDHEAIAKRCIDHISTFSPERAAKEILEGCLSILEGCDT